MTSSSEFSLRRFDGLEASTPLVLAATTLLNSPTEAPCEFRSHLPQSWLLVLIRWLLPKARPLARHSPRLARIMFQVWLDKVSRSIDLHLKAGGDLLILLCGLVLLPTYRNNQAVSLPLQSEHCMSPIWCYSFHNCHVPT